MATFAIGSERPELLLKAAEADAQGDAEESVFYRKLHAVCVRWGYYSRKRIFSPDLSTPSKMQEMDILLKPGAIPPSFRPAHASPCAGTPQCRKMRCATN